MSLSGYDELPAAEQPMPASAQFAEPNASEEAGADSRFLGPLDTAALTDTPDVSAGSGESATVPAEAIDNPFAAAVEPDPFAAAAENPFAAAEPAMVDAAAANPFASAAEPATARVTAANPFADSRQESSDNPFAPAGEESGEAVVRTASFQSGTAASQVQPASATSTNRATTTFHPATPRMPASPRVPVVTHGGVPQQACPPCEVTIAAAGPEQALAYPDEFIYDGGDRDIPVHYNGGVMAGLDTEDTVVEYSDSEGRNRVTPSNRVAVYAPRFGSVRTVSGPGIGMQVDQAAGAVDFAAVGGLSESRGIDAAVAGTPAEGLRMRASASGVDVAVPASQSAQASAAAVNLKVDQGFESRVNTGPGTLEMTDIRELSLQIVDAATSTRRTSRIQTTGSTQATQTYATFRPQATIGVEQNRRKGEIFLTKKATPLIAQPGDTVTFTIEFSNIGDLAVSDVRIIDNLTPRLAYTSGTGQITVSTGGGGSLTVVPNKEGSQMVEFQLDQPLPGGATGTITFDALVQ